jgi:tetratricopeptide (TPR) repeat protein
VPLGHGVDALVYRPPRAGAYEIAGQIEEGAARLEQALQLVERTGERWLAAELDRQRGRLLLRQGHAEAAEELYHKALSIAREQEAKLWELRGAASLAQLWRDQGRRAEPATCLLRSMAGSPRASPPRPSRSAGTARPTGCVAGSSFGPDNLVGGKRPVMAQTRFCRVVCDPVATR